MESRPADVTRRGFLKGAAAFLAAPYVIPSTALGDEGRLAPSERIGMGFIGVGGQGGGHLLGGAWTYVPGGYTARGDVQVLAISDIWRDRRENARNRVNDFYSKKAGAAYKSCEACADFREVLARKDVDAVLIATPIHWHAMMTAMAAKAGKDVYCEKPTALTIEESRAARDAIRRYGRVFQAGTQQRSEYGGKFRLACEYVRSGRIGQLKSVYSNIGGGGFTWVRWFGGGRPVPPNLDWDLFLGPAPWSPFRGSTDAHLFGFGGINWGQHHFDIVQWGADADDTGPVELGWEDGKVAMRYANGVVVYCARYPGEKIGGSGGASFVGTEGRIAVDRENLASFPPEILKKPLGPHDVHLYTTPGHSANFLECIRTRKRTITDIESSHRAASLLVLGGIAEQLKRPLKWDPRAERFIGDAEADRMLSVPCRPPWRL
jgi:predicted dehydrogenase